MSKTIAKYFSSVLGTCAVLFVAILKPILHSPEVPKELLK
ncbi:cyclic lactone autoinducer peptide [Paenibacillaceae bacterium]|nr:cyclic lactone autoinducer peptide [Paenibacillaceae bacterium]